MTEAQNVWQQLSRFERDVNRVLWSLQQGEDVGWIGPNEHYTRLVLDEAVSRCESTDDTDYGICDECGQPYDEGGKVCDCKPDEYYEDLEH